MITNFNTYILLEKSTLNQFIKNNKFINAFHSQFNGYVLENPNIKEIDLTKYNLEYHIENNLDYYKIIIIETENYFYVINVQLTRQPNLFVYDKKQKDNDLFRICNFFGETPSTIARIVKENIEEDIINSYLVYTRHNKKLSDDTVNFGKNLSFDKTSLKDEIEEYFIKNYRKIFVKYYIKLLVEYNSKLKEIYKNKNLTENDKLKIDKLEYDVLIITSFISNPFHKITFSSIITDVDKKLKNVGIYSHEYSTKIDVEYFHVIIHNMVKRIYDLNNNYLNFKTQEIVDRELSKDFSLWYLYKDKIYDEEILKKYKHLTDAENFDIL